jgi:hypothetical protein
MGGDSVERRQLGMPRRVTKECSLITLGRGECEHVLAGHRVPGRSSVRRVGEVRCRELPGDGKQCSPGRVAMHPTPLPGTD